MSKHRKTQRTPRISARRFAATGVGGAAVVGVAVLLAVPPGGPTHTVAARDVQLTSFGSPLTPPPLAPTTNWWLYEPGSGLVGAGVNPTAAMARISSAAIPSLPIIGFFIGDGADALPGCVGSACNGGNAGILFGNGGDGFNGGRGGNGGVFFGDGGNGRLF
ncbi:hypothetical protein [Mycolicibacterium vinylchloridicum]|uniref:hypothetical protein n=1 Tax=Mycolicibacterium vinylchloridicum TaxID=2736928 RepID=UPI0015CE8996|nr:hypothetical protein [Mycolicibacterium vinylchloridicum]